MGSYADYRKRKEQQAGSTNESASSGLTPYEQYRQRKEAAAATADAPKTPTFVPHSSEPHTLSMGNVSYIKDMNAKRTVKDLSLDGYDDNMRAAINDISGHQSFYDSIPEAPQYTDSMLYVHSLPTAEELKTGRVQYDTLKKISDYSEKSVYEPKDVGARMTVQELNSLSYDEQMDRYNAARTADSSQEDLLYEAVNGNFIALQELDQKGYEIFQGMDEIYRTSPSELQQLTEEEKGLFNYVYKTLGLNAAKDYLNHLAPHLSNRQRQTIQDNAAKQAEKHPVLSSLDTIVTSPFRGQIASMGMVSDLLEDGKISSNADYNRLEYQANAIRGKVSETIETQTPLGKVGSFLYNTGMSVGDSVARTITSVGNPMMSAYLAASNAGSSTVSNAKDLGLTDIQALSLGVVSAVAEGFFEKHNLEDLLNADLMKDGTLKYILKNSLNEATEEMSTETVNMVADIIIAWDKGQMRTAIDQYKAQGMDAKQASLHAFGDKLLEIAGAGLSGAVSGGAMSGGNVTLNAIVNAVNKGFSNSKPSTSSPSPTVQAPEIRPGPSSDIPQKNAPLTPSQAVTEQEAEEEWVDLPTFEGPVESEAEREAREEEARRAELSGANVLGPWVAGALEDFRQRGSISYMSAILIGSDPQSVRKLTELTGVQIPEGDSAARQAAIEEAVSALAEQPIENFQSKQNTFRADSTEDAPAVSPMVEELINSLPVKPAESATQSQSRQDLQEIIDAQPFPAQNTPAPIDTAENSDYDDKNTTGGITNGTGEETLPSHPGGIGETASGSGQAGQRAIGGRSGIQRGEETAAQTAVWSSSAEGPLTESSQAFSEEDYITAEPGSVRERLQREVLTEYGVTSHIVKKTAWTKDRPAFARNGEIYICETLDGEDFVEAISHELTHVMKQTGFRPYLDFIEATPEYVDLSKASTHTLLKDIANHRGIDYFSMDDTQTQGLYDELNAAVYGAYRSGQLDNPQNRAMLEAVFPNLDGYLSELDDIFSQFKSRNPTDLTTQPPSSPTDAGLADTQSTEGEAKAPETSVGAAPADFTGKSSYNDLLHEGNVQPDRPGDVRPMEVPRTDSYGRHVSETAANLYGAEITPDETASQIEELIAMGALGFDTKTNKQMVEEAAAAIKKKGVAASEKAVTKAVFSGKAQDSDIVTAALLYTTYANRQGEAAQNKAAELAVDLATMANDAGRRLQLFKLIRKMTPQGQLMAVKKGVERSLERINKGRGKNNQAEVTIPQELVDEYLDAAQRDIQEQTEETAKQKEEIEQAIYKAAAAQIKASPMEKLNAWRYMAMLGNAKTQARNFFGNAVFRSVVSVKRAVGAVMERVFVEQENRTKSILGLGKDAKALVKWAKEDAKSKSTQQLLSYSGLTGDTARDAIEQERRIYDTKWLEAARQFVQKIPEGADMIFKSREYAYSLASFVKARGYTSADILAGNVSEDTLNAARSYATQEALKATFNDHNVVSDFLSKRYNGSNSFGKAINILAEGVLPFRRTPANILVRGLEYSPVNVARSIWNLSTKVRSGDMSAATAIDQMASGLTGTAAIALGYALAAGVFGFRLRGKIEDEDELRTGHQEYAFEIGDRSYTVDWLAPTNIPLFIGANIYELQNGEGDVGWFASALNAAGTSLEPMLELSCLSSLNDLVESSKYAEDGTALWSIAASAATSYMTQFIPTLFGQVEQATEHEKQSAYSSAATPVERSIEKTIGRMTQRIPGIDLFQAQKYDAWGNEIETSSAYQSFVNPAYKSQITNDPVDQEISRLNKAQDKNVSPSLPSQTISYLVDENGTREKRRLTADEYETLCKAQGQNQRRLVESILSNPEYKNLSDAEKAAAISCAYDYAETLSKSAVVDYREDPPYITNRPEGMSEAEAILRYTLLGSSTAYADLPIRTAVYVDALVDAITPETKSDGTPYTNVRPIQKMEAVLADDSLEAYADALLREYLEEGAERRYDAALTAGYTEKEFVEAYRKNMDTEGKGAKQSVILYIQQEMGMSYVEAKKLYDILNNSLSSD